MLYITREQLENWFTYHKPFGNQPERYEDIRKKAFELAVVIANDCPDCADTTAALRLLRQAVMQANDSIACNEYDT